MNCRLFPTRSGTEQADKKRFLLSELHGYCQRHRRPFRERPADSGTVKKSGLFGFRFKMPGEKGNRRANGQSERIKRCRFSMPATPSGGDRFQVNPDFRNRLSPPSWIVSRSS
jgi:hypothetical protein